MADEKLEAILNKIQESYRNVLKNPENNDCVNEHRDEIEKILYKDSFLACDAIRVFLLFNCKIEDKLELIFNLNISAHERAELEKYQQILKEETDKEKKKEIDKKLEIQTKKIFDDKLHTNKLLQLIKSNVGQAEILEFNTKNATKTTIRHKTI